MQGAIAAAAGATATAASGKGSRESEIATSSATKSPSHEIDYILMALYWLASACSVASAAAFVPPSSRASANFIPPTFTPTKPAHARTAIVRMSLEVEQRPDQKELDYMGARDWLSTPVTSGGFTEPMPKDALRLIAEGSGTVSYDGQTSKVKPGTLITALADVSDVVWAVDAGCDEMLLATPEYWKPERIAARAAIPAVTAVLGGLGACAAAYVAFVG